MKATDDLFHLIKSLDKNEKRYFSLFNSLHEKANKKYLLLFSEMDKQKEYDEQAIKKKFRDEPFVRQLTFTKNYLYRLILKSMRSYYSDKTEEMRMKNNLQDANFLSGKGLYKQCEKLILRTKQTAGKYDKHLILLELLGMEIGLTRIQSFAGKPEKTVTEIFEEIFRVADRFINSNRYYYASSQILIRIQKKGYPREKKDFMMYQRAFNNILSDVDVASLSFRELSYYYSCCDVYFFTQNDFQNMYLFASKLVKLLEENPHQIAENLYQYIGALYNLLLSQLNLKKYDEMFSAIQKLREIHIDNKHIRNELFFLMNDMELTIYNNTGQFAEGVNLINSITGQFEEHNIATLNIQHKMTFYFTIACIYFGAENYQATNIWLNKIVNEEVDTRSDYHCFAKILKLITYFELNNQDLLEYVIKSTYRFLEKKKRLYRFETLVLDFIRKKIPEITSRQELFNTFISLKAEVEEITKDPFEKKALEYFDFISWMDSKMEHISFVNAVKRKQQ